MLLALAGGNRGTLHAQNATFAGDPQHTANYSVPAQPLSTLRWSTSVDLNNTGAFAHYGAPLITPSNTVLVPIRGTNVFLIRAFDGGTGQEKYTVTSDWIQPVANWILPYQPVIAFPPSGPRLYYPGAGGTIYYRENFDAATPGAPVQICFYTNLLGYASNATAFNNTVFVNTPITADTSGNIFFGFRIQSTAPAPLSTTNNGFVRIDPAGNATYVLAPFAAGDNRISRNSHSSAPALSHDETTVYVPVKGTNANYAYLLGLDSTTLATKYKVQLRDPRNNNFASVPDDATSSPTVGPDGDVYFGVLASPNNGSRGFLLHFSADLQTQKPPSAFGWDFTPGIVPTNVVKGYQGNSPYLLFSKYNNYAFGDGNGVNRVAILDPNATQLDHHASAPGLIVMREVFTVISCTPDNQNQSATYPYAVREWCINTAAVNPVTQSVFVPCEDGRLYRWNLSRNALAEVFTLGPGIGQPYVPTAVGPEGTVYALNGGKLFAVGGFTNLSITLDSTAADLREAVVGQEITFSVIVTNLGGVGPLPTGTVTFEDRIYQGLTLVSNLLAAAVPLTNGGASVTTSALTASTNQLGNHFITARYSGDANYPTGAVTFLQKIHAYATTTTLNSTSGPGGNVILTANVSSGSAGGRVPTGQVAFWSGTNLLRQVPLNTNGIASITNTFSDLGGKGVTATYASDTLFASSSGSLTGAPPYLKGSIILGGGAFKFGFSNIISAPFTVYGSTDVVLPATNWGALGPASEILPGVFQFVDVTATNHLQRFYRVQSP